MPPLEEAKPKPCGFLWSSPCLTESPNIDLPHLEAGYAVWRYCEDSARIIFGAVDEDRRDPLEESLLAIITNTPGINRKGLHRSTGGHVPATKLVRALANLRDQGLVQPRMVATAGRPAECWFPCQTAEATAPVALSSFVRTKNDTEPLPIEREVSNPFGVTFGELRTNEQRSYK